MQVDGSAIAERRPEGESGKLEVCVIGMHYAPEHTGNAPYTTGLVSALVAGGHKVRVVTGYPHYPAWRIHEGYVGLRIDDSVHGVPVTRVRHPVPSSPDALRRIVMDASFAAHSALVRVPRPDVVVAVSPALLTVAAAILRRRQGRTALGVVTQDLYSRALLETEMTSNRVAQWASKLESALLRRADGVAVVHEQFRDAVQRLGVNGGRISVIRNWSHVRSPSHGGDRDRVRAQFGWRRDEIIALHAGNMGVKQGLENVVEAARLADETGASVRFKLMGDGSRRGALVEAARGVKSLHFMEPLPDDQFADALSAADVLIVNEAPTVAEMSVPSKLTSYFVAGRPVVAASWPRSAASAELRRSGGGVRVDPADPQALLTAIVSLAQDPTRSREIADAGRSYAAEHLTQAAAYSRYCRWIESLAAARTYCMSRENYDA